LKGLVSFFSFRDFGYVITLVEVIKNDMLIKEVTEHMALDIIEWRKNIHVADAKSLTNMLRIQSQPQNFGTKALLLLL